MTEGGTKGGFQVSAAVWRQHRDAMLRLQRAQNREQKRGQREWGIACDAAARSTARAAPGVAARRDLLVQSRLIDLRTTPDGELVLRLESSELHRPGGILRVRFENGRGTGNRLRLRRSCLMAWECRRAPGGRIESCWVFHNGQILLSGSRVRVDIQRMPLRVARRHRCRRNSKPRSTKLVQIEPHPPMGLGNRDGTRAWPPYRGWNLFDAVTGRPDSDAVVVLNLVLGIPVAYCPFCGKRLPGWIRRRASRAEGKDDRSDRPLRGRPRRAANWR